MVTHTIEYGFTVMITDGFMNVGQFSCDEYGLYMSFGIQSCYDDTLGSKA